MDCLIDGTYGTCCGAPQVAGKEHCKLNAKRAASRVVDMNNACWEDVIFNAPKQEFVDILHSLLTRSTKWILKANRVENNALLKPD